MTILLASLAQAADPVPPVNALFMGETHETAADPALAEEPLSLHQKRGLQALEKANTRFLDLKVIAGESGYRSVSEGRGGKWEVDPVAVFSENILGGNFTVTRSGKESTTTEQGPAGKMFFVRAVPGRDDKTMEIAFVTTAFANTATPEVVSRTPKKAAILLEIFEGPVEKARELLKPANGRLDCPKLLKELRTLAKSGSFSSHRLPPLSLASGKRSDTAWGPLTLKIEPTLSKNEEWVDINYLLTQPGDRLTAKVNVKNGDSMLLGSLESATPGHIRLVFLHTSPEP